MWKSSKVYIFPKLVWVKIQMLFKLPWGRGAEEKLFMNFTEQKKIDFDYMPSEKIGQIMKWRMFPFL